MIYFVSSHTPLLGNALWVEVVIFSLYVLLNVVKHVIAVLLKDWTEFS